MSYEEIRFAVAVDFYFGMLVLVLEWGLHVGLSLIWNHVGFLRPFGDF